MLRALSDRLAGTPVVRRGKLAKSTLVRGRHNEWQITNRRDFVSGFARESGVLLDRDWMRSDAEGVEGHMVHRPLVVISVLGADQELARRNADKARKRLFPHPVGRAKVYSPHEAGTVCDGADAVHLREPGGVQPL